METPYRSPVEWFGASAFDKTVTSQAVKGMARFKVALV